MQPVIQEDTRKLNVVIRCKVTGEDFFHTAEAEYVLTLAQLEALQRTVLGALLSMQKTAP
jgi:hypothetical protein